MQNISVSADAQSADVKWHTATDFSSHIANSLLHLSLLGLNEKSIKSRFLALSGDKMKKEKREL